MSNNWEDVFLGLEENQVQETEKYYESIKKDFEEAQHDLEVLILLWYAQFTIKSLADSRKLLTTGELRDFKSLLSEYMKKPVDPEWVKKLKRIESRKHISRFEMIQIQLVQVIHEMFYPYESTIEGFLLDTYKENYYRTSYQIAIGTNGGTVLHEIEKIIFKPWAVDGRVFSERIWGDKTKLINELNVILTRGLATDSGQWKMIEELTKRMKVSHSNAARLVSTEVAYSRSLSQQQSFNDTGVEEYKIVATLDHRTSVTCRALDGRIFKMSEFKIGVTAPPFHPRCRTVTVPYYGVTYGTRVARDKDGNTIYIPSDMTYNEWYDKFVKD